MAASANPLATEAGREILRAGGSAVDAAIAIQMVLTLVEPQSSGLGGGAFLLHWDGKALRSYDGRETAPRGADENLFMADGKPMGFYQAVVGGRSVGTPGVLRMLALAHRQYGKLPWARLFDPAIKLADEGFTLSPRLHALLASEKYLASDPAARTYFFDASGAPKAVGTRLRNPELAATLRTPRRAHVAAARRGEGRLGTVARERHVLLVGPACSARSGRGAWKVRPALRRAALTTQGQAERRGMRVTCLRAHHGERRRPGVRLHRGIGDDGDGCGHVMDRNAGARIDRVRVAGAVMFIGMPAIA